MTEQLIFEALAASPQALGQFPGMALLADQSGDTLHALKKRQKAIVEDIESGHLTSERVQKLRQWMQIEGVDAVVIPLRDEFFGEYVPLTAQRLAWLTGFTGSNGMAVVMQDKAAFFSDGRYTLQMRQQIDQTVFECLHIIEEPPIDWLKAHLKLDSVLAYDPWLHSILESQAWIDALKSIEIRPLEHNPIDVIWAEKPPAPLSPIWFQSPELSGQSSKEKCQFIGQKLLENKADFLVLTQSDSICWLLNVRASDVPCTPFLLSFAVVKSDGCVDWFYDARKLESQPTELAHVTAHEWTAFEAYLTQNSSGNRFWVAEQTCPVRIIHLVKENQGQLLLSNDPCQLPKAVKNSSELAGIRLAHRIDAVALCRFLCWFDQLDRDSKPTEISLADQLQTFREQSENLLNLSFESISGAGPNGAIVHYRVTPESNRVLQRDEVYLIDSGGQYPQGTTDVTRTMVFGEASAEIKKRFTLVLKGHIQLSLTRFPQGTNGAQLDTIARHALWQEGLDYDHGTGHGVGACLSVHEGPQSIGKGRSAVPLQAGMVLSNEPGYYKTDGYGIRIENLVEVVKIDEQAAERELLGFENLTLAPIDRNMIEVELLTDAEQNWLNAYHQRVYESVAAELNPEEQKWLKSVTQAV